MLPVADSSRPQTTEYIDRPIAYNDCYSATGLIDHGNSTITLLHSGRLLHPLISVFFQMTDSCVCLVTG